MEPLRLHYIQTHLFWEDIESNLRHFSTLIGGNIGETDLIILPEMFASGFSMQPDRIAETMDGSVVKWMREKASGLNAVVTGSVAIRDSEKYYNRLICAHPDGSVSHYDKRHLFTFAGEDQRYAPGGHHLQITVKGWKIMPFVCYDLRFPVWCRNVSDFDVALFVANWPAPRINAWTALLKARAIENQCYVVGINRIGDDPNGNHYPGKSAVYDVSGEIIHESGSEEAVAAIQLEYEPLMTFRKRFAFLPDQDRFQLLD